MYEWNSSALFMKKRAKKQKTKFIQLSRFLRYEYIQMMSAAVGRHHSCYMWAVLQLFVIYITLVTGKSDFNHAYHLIDLHQRKIALDFTTDRHTHTHTHTHRHLEISTHTFLCARIHKSEGRHANSGFKSNFPFVSDRRMCDMDNVTRWCPLPDLWLSNVGDCCGYVCFWHAGHWPWKRGTGENESPQIPQITIFLCAMKFNVISPH